MTAKIAGTLSSTNTSAPIVTTKVSVTTAMSHVADPTQQHPTKQQLGQTEQLKLKQAENKSSGTMYRTLLAKDVIQFSLAVEKTPDVHYQKMPYLHDPVQEMCNLAVINQHKSYSNKQQKHVKYI